MDTTLATQPSSGTWNLIFVLLGLLIPVLSAFLTKWFMNWLKSFSATVDNTGTTTKQLLVLLISTLLTLAFHFFGVAVTGDTTLTGLNAPDVQALITAALAMVLHNSEKLKGLQTGPRNLSARSTIEEPAHEVRSGYKGKTDQPPRNDPKKDY